MYVIHIFEGKILFVQNCGVSNSLKVVVKKVKLYEKR